MSSNSKNWIKTTLILSTLFLLSRLSPSGTFDPWNLFSPKKIINLLFGLALIQSIGALMIQYLGPRIGAILTGFLGGLISSTATTANLARQSLKSSQRDTASENLIFLSATLAMLFEAMAITIFGTQEIHGRLFIIFAGPILAAIGMIIAQSRSAKGQPLVLKNTWLEIGPLLKLSIFVIGVLTLSKLLQNIFGQAGLLTLTFLVSLFEIHGSVIANLQLHDRGAIDINLLGGLLAISITASYISKYFLIMSLGSSSLKRSTLKYSAFLFLSLLTCWSIFQFARS